jgi:RHS repeat-associated protein
MQLASSARLPDGLLAAQWLGAEKPHQGVSTQKQAWHPAPSVYNSTTALGLRAGCAGNRVRSFCSGEQYDSDLGLYYLRARYYNPATGRFLSRDPEDGKAKVPASLHKYLYAQGDPMNKVDPSGRDAIITYALSIGEKAPGILALELTDIAVNKVLECVAAWLAVGFGQEYAWFACYDVPF